ncbi:hypothetical protein ACFYP4_13060 [Streptomyces sp. NPDC005551]|uniref:hypothetical protein n=1 Tax=Streptomyces sp. NPDC005551 TaxID=3364725 RepID=UPI0036A6F12A
MSALHQRTARSGRDVRLLRAAVFAAVCVALAAAGHGIASCTAVPLWTVGTAFLAVFAVAAPLAGRERALPGIATVLAVGQTALHTLFGLGQQGTSMTPAPGGTGMSASMGASMTSGMPGHALSDASLVERAARVVCGASAAAISPAQAQRILTDARLAPDTAHSVTTPSAHHSADAVSAAAGPSMSMLPSLPMLLVHVLAAVATGWLLRRGDLAVVRLIRLSAHGVAETALVRSLRAALALVRALRTGLPGSGRTAPRAPRTAPPEPPTPRTTALQHSVIRRGPPQAAVLVLAA